MKKILCFLLILFSIQVLCFSENPDRTATDETSVHDRSSSDGNPSTHIYLGIEYGELAQNDYRDIGADNFTFVAGQRFQSSNLRKFGWRILAVKAELSSEHLQNPDEVAYIEGNRQDLSGDVMAVRAYWDFYPYTLDIGRCRALDAPVLSVAPVLSGGLGYNSWGFINTAYDEEYRLNALTVSIGACLHTELFGILFLENPLLDFFLYTIKNRDVQGEIGDTSITRPKVWGLFSWATIGFIIRL